jgi:hypothetical protein
MNPSPKLRERGPSEFLAAHPPIVEAIDRTRGKIALKARVEVDALAADLKLVLSHWCEERSIAQISWASANDPVKPEFAIDHLADRLAQKLAQVRFEKFLETFCEQAIELSEAERCSQ